MESLLNVLGKLGEQHPAQRLSLMNEMQALSTKDLLETKFDL